METAYQASVRSWTPTLEEIGVENLRIRCLFDGRYGHHQSLEDDYGWNGIKFRGVRNGWISNVVVEDCIQDITLFDSINMTVQRGGNEGWDGHFGIAINRSWFNLVTDVRQHASRTHHISVSSGSIGNVFRNVQNLTPVGGSIDFHGGGFSSRNLFERLVNMRATGAGAERNMPHAGQENVFGTSWPALRWDATKTSSRVVGTATTATMEPSDWLIFIAFFPRASWWAFTIHRIRPKLAPRKANRKHLGYTSSA
jgi:hypothetical protein